MTQDECGAKVSVVMPALNAGALISRALHSVFAQGAAISQVIVVNDGSTDDTGRALDPFLGRIDYMSQQNLGPASARNTGVAQARHEYLAFLDADDEWPRGALPKALARLTAGAELAGVHGLTQLVRGGRADQAEALGRPWRSPQLGSLLIRRIAFERVGRFDESLRYGEDLDWFVRARDARITLAAFDEIMLLYRIHDRNMTRNRDRRGQSSLLVLKRALERRRRNAEKPGTSC